MTTLISFIIVVGIIVFVHELGHYLAAKLSGMYVETFSIGFGPALVKKKWGDTEYKISAIPLGGYVKIAGMIDESLEEESFLGKDDERLFEKKPAILRFFALISGVLMNFLLAIIIYTGLVYHQGIGEVDGTIIGETAPEYPAQQAGLVEGDKIIAINDTFIEKWEDMSSIVHKNPGKEITFTIERDEKYISIPVTSREEESIVDEKKTTIGIVGISPKIKYREAGFGEAITEGLAITWSWTKLGVTTIKMLVTGQAGVTDLAGPVMIAKMSGDSVRSGATSFLAFIAFISINIGFLNLLPIPALDGGHILSLLIETIIRRKISVDVKMRIQQVGMLFLFAIMIIVVFNDILRVAG